MLCNQAANISQAQIQKCEGLLLLFLEWRTLVPTPTEILNLFLFIINPDQELEEIKQDTTNLIFDAMMRYEMAMFRPSTIALSCLFIDLLRKEYTQFIEQLESFISEYDITFDFEEVERCKMMLVELLTAEEI